MSISERSVRLTTNNPQADILLINSLFSVVARRATPLDATIPVGIYAMKVKVGDEETEELFAVPRGTETIEKYLTAPEFGSPVPLSNTSTTHEYHQAVVSKYLAHDAPRIVRGTGSSLMVCVRDPSKMNFAVPESERHTYANNFNNFRLLNCDGVELVNLDKEAEQNVANGYMATRVELDPGSYTLAYRHGDEQICLPLPTAAGWTLQVYLQLAPTTTDGFEKRPDFRDVALIFDRSTNGFQPNRSDLQAIETVRKGLIEGRNYVDTTIMREMLQRKFENPILGLYAAHLFLLEPSVNVGSLEEVVRNTAAMLGERYPDIVALAWACQRQSGRPLSPTIADLKTLLGQLAGPPLLARSWDLLIDAAREFDATLIGRSPAFRMAGDLVSQGVYLTWRTSRREPAQAADSIGKVLEETKAVPKATRSLLAGLADFAFKLLQGLRRKTGSSPAGPLPVESIERIKDNEEAAAVLRWLAQSYDWNLILGALKRDPPEWMGKLEGLQRDLMMTMRNASLDKDSIDALTSDFVTRLLDTHRVPLETLARSLSGLEMGGYWSTTFHQFISESKTRRRAEQSNAPGRAEVT